MEGAAGHSEAEQSGAVPILAQRSKAKRFSREGYGGIVAQRSGAEHSTAQPSGAEPSTAQQSDPTPPHAIVSCNGRGHRRRARMARKRRNGVGRDSAQTVVEEDTAVESTDDGSMVHADIRIEGISELQFDRFVRADGPAVEPHEKLYLDGDGKSLVIPAANFLAFFYGAGNSKIKCCANLFSGKGKGSEVAQHAKALLSVTPTEVPLMRDGKPIKFSGKFRKGSNGRAEDAAAKMYVHIDKATDPTKHTPIPNIQRPTLRTPWAGEFGVDVYEFAGSPVTMRTVWEWLVKGGILIGICAHRPMFGKFRVAKFLVGREDWAVKG